jgi:hypothetical protein
MNSAKTRDGLVNVGAALLRRSVPLERRHDLSRFDCGNEGLNAFLKKEAMKNQTGSKERTFVVTLGQSARVVGYYTLVTSINGLPGHERAGLTISRLALDKDYRGSGETLWRDADERRFARR